MKPKVHLFDHAIRHSLVCRMSVAWHWCFSDGGFIGKVKAVAKGCHPRDCGFRALQRRSMRFFSALLRLKSRAQGGRSWGQQCGCNSSLGICQSSLASCS
eukprot:1853420-Alexandrium_andersonii.AAC.1